MRRFNLGPVGEADCPVFDGMFDYCAVSAYCYIFISVPLAELVESIFAA